MKNRVKIIKGDITTLKVDAIVNAANNTLRGGGGVDGAIHMKAGPGLLEECTSIGGCPTGEAVITGGYNLPSPKVIHTVGPVWKGGHHEEHRLLASSYRRSLEIARDNGIRSLAFPSISTGIYNFPVEEASLIAITEVKHFLEKNVLPAEVIFVAFDDDVFLTYNKLLEDEAIL